MKLKKIIAVFLLTLVVAGASTAYAASYGVTFLYGVTGSPTAYKSTNGYIRDANTYAYVVTDQAWDIAYQGSAWVGGYPNGEQIGSYRYRDHGTTYSYTENGVSGYGQLRFDNSYVTGYTVYATGTIS